MYRKTHYMFRKYWNTVKHGRPNLRAFNIFMKMFIIETKVNLFNLRHERRG